MYSDCHMHMILDGQDWRAAIARHADAPAEGWIRQQLARYQALGYDYLRDGGDRWGAGATARQLAPEYGITYRTPLAPLCLRGYYGSFIGKAFGNLQEFRALLRETRENGGDFVKIMISGLMDFDRPGVLTQPAFSPDQIRDWVTAARDAGFAVMVHANGAQTIQVAAEAGVDSVEHGAYADGEALAAMAELGTVWVPTLSTVANLRGTGRFREESVAAILADTQGKLREFAALGGLIAPGSDAGAWAVPHGCHTELGLLKETLGPGAEAILARGTAKIREFF